MNTEKAAEPMITITRQEYDKLCKDSLRLQALSDTGVDNWEGYDQAIQLYADYLNA